MRYAALATASAAVLAILTLPRDGRSEAATLAAQAAPATQTAPAVQRAATQEDFRWSGRIARGDEIEIRGLMGNVRAEATSGDQVEVIGRRSGEGADQVRIEVVETDDGVTICTIYPVRERRSDGHEARRARGNDNNGPCRNGRSGEIQVEDARIDFTVRVPAGVRLAASTVEGDIEATGLRSPVDAASVSGNVRVSTTESARAATVSGNVDATFGRTDGGEMDFASVSGDVVVRLAGDVGARVDAHTLSGDIQSDFDLRIRPGGASDDDDAGGFRIEIGKEASGTIGRGGPALSLNTVSGDIRVLRGR